MIRVAGNIGDAAVVATLSCRCVGDVGIGGSLLEVPIGDSGGGSIEKLAGDQSRLGESNVVNVAEEAIGVIPIVKPPAHGDHAPVPSHATACAGMKGGVRAGGNIERDQQGVGLLSIAQVASIEAQHFTVGGGGNGLPLLRGDGIGGGIQIPVVPCDIGERDRQNAARSHREIERCRRRIPGVGSQAVAAHDGLKSGNAIGTDGGLDRPARRRPVR